MNELLQAIFVVSICHFKLCNINHSRDAIKIDFIPVNERVNAAFVECSSDSIVIKKKQGVYITKFFFDCVYTFEINFSFIHNIKLIN